MNAAFYPARLATVLAVLAILSLANAEEPAATPKPPPDGVKQTFNEKGKLIAEETYLNGVLHGPSKKWDGRGTLLAKGAYKHGKMDGVWREYRGTEMSAEKNYKDGILHGPYRSGFAKVGTVGQYVEGEQDGEWVSWRRRQNHESKSTQYFRRGVRDGKWEYASTNLKAPVQITFKAGQVASPPELKDLPLLKRYAALGGPGKPRDELLERAFAALFAQDDFEYPETPLSEIADDLADRFLLTVIPDRIALESNKRSVKSSCTINDQGIPPLLGLVRIAKQQGLTLDYRHHTIWLTRQDMADAWKGDATGAMALAPAKGSSLEQALDKTVKSDHAANPPDVVVLLGKEYGVTVEVSAAVPMISFLEHAKLSRRLCREVTVRELLAVTLHQAGCVCVEKKGTLVIVPQMPVQ